MTGRLRVLANLGPAMVMLVIIEACLHTTSVPRLARTLGVPLQTEPLNEPLRVVSVWRLGPRDAARYRAVQLVAAAWPCRARGVCLRLALVAGYMLRRRSPNLHLGVASFNGDTTAHAWISVDGLLFDPAAKDYVCLTGLAG